MPEIYMYSPYLLVLINLNAALKIAHAKPGANMTLGYSGSCAGRAGPSKQDLLCGMHQEGLGPFSLLRSW